MKIFRKQTQICTVFLCMLFFILLLVPARYTVAEENAGDPLTVGVPADRCPMFYQDPESHEVVGIGADLMRTAAEEAGYDITFKIIEEASLKEALDNEVYDVVMPFGSTIQTASGKDIVVSDNLIQTPFTLVTTGRKNMPPVKELRIGMLSSLSGGADTVRQMYPGVEIELYDTMPEAVKALRAKKVDALLHNSYVWSYVLQKPSYQDLQVQPSAMFSMDFRVGAVDTPEGQDKIERLNQGIATLTETYQQAVVLDYTTRRLYKNDIFDYLFLYGHLMVVAIVLLISVIIISVFRRRALRLEQEKKVRWLKDHDELTGVLSLDGFRKKVVKLLHANPDTPYVLAYVNIKNFKFINDSFGMIAGDNLLRFWLKKTEETLSDKEAVCRIESDHVAVLRFANEDEKLDWDDKEIIDSVRNYFVERGKETRIQICGGVYVLTPDDYQSPDVDHMLDFARLAEKKVRATQNDGYIFYNPEQWEKGKRLAEIISYFPVAIKSGELHVWYQPQVDYQTGEINGLEALSRWKHSKLGWIPPSDFIPELEESGLIYDLDSYVWDRVCQDLKKWNEQGNHRSVSVNVSRSDITRERDIPGHFHDLISKYGLSADQFRIEITETAFAKDPELLIETTDKLRELGFQVEMDDFGSGYSSLHMLKEVPVDRIKLDLNFLTGKGDAVKGNTIVGYMIQMINALGMKMIVEGVETKEQADFLLSKGCSEMQGYYFYKPMSPEDFDKIFETKDIENK